MKRLLYYTKPDQSIKTAWLFLLIVFVVVVIASLFKLGAIVAKSSFDGSHRFTILLKSNPAKIISASPENNTFSILTVSSPDDSLEKTLGIFVDGRVQNKASDSKIVEEISNTNKPGELLHGIFNNYTKIETNLTIVDVIRLLWYADSVKPQAVLAKHIVLPKTLSITSISLLDKQITELFVDPTILNENISISVINGAGTSGLGNRYSRLLTNNGSNVVSIESANRPIVRSSISYYGDISYTAKHLTKIFGYPLVKMKKRDVSDIIIQIGEDYRKYRVY